LKKADIKGRIILRMYAMLAMVVIMGVAVLVKGYSIQAYKDGYWKRVADSLTTSLKVMPAERGNIYSADDCLLATSMPYFDLHIDFGSDAMTEETFDKNVDSLAWYMANTFREKSQRDYRMSLVRSRKAKKRYFLLCKKADYTLLKEIRQWPLIREGKYEGGLIVETLQQRKNPYGILAQRTIGSWRENAPNVGLEAQYKSFLQGSEGKRLMQRIAGGIWIPLTSESAIEPRNGNDIVTTIDVNLQDVAENALYRAMIEHNAENGCVVLMEVKTGAIKAIANLGKSAEGVYTEKLNYAVLNSTEPGSTIKVASYLAMFDDGLIKPSDMVDINNGKTVYSGHKMEDAGGWVPYTEVTVEESFARSSNVGTSRLAVKAYGQHKNAFYEKLDKFGLTMLSGIDLQGEPAPVISKAASWSALSVPWKSIGYEMKLTPLQVLTFYNTVANDGKRMQPYLVQRIMNNGKVVKEIQPKQISGPIASPQALADITQIMRAVVENDTHGTAKKIYTPFFAIAGKTGTAKLNDPGKGYLNKHQASFCGFFPADQPKYSCIVVIIGPSGIHQHGGDVAAPVFKELADKIMSTDLNMKSRDNLLASDARGHLPPAVIGELNDVIQISKYFGYKIDPDKENDFLYARPDSSSIKVKEIGFASGKVPDVIGLAPDDAIYLLENMGMQVQITGAGKVRQQSLPSGSQVMKGATIQLLLG